MNAIDESFITPLSFLGLLRVSGSGAKTLLQGQLTCHLEEVSENRAPLGALCQPQGRVISLFRIWQIESDYFLEMPRNNLENTLTTLKKYAVFYKAQLEDLSEQYESFSLYGNTLAEHLETMFPLLTQAENAVITIDPFRFLRLTGKEKHYECLAPKNAFSTLQAKLSAKTGNENTWRGIQIREGFPSIYAETSGLFLPHEIQLEKLAAISFNKGCFTGQEIIARMHYRGKLNKGLLIGSTNTETPPQLGADIYHEGKTRGSLVDYFEIEKGSYGLLVMTDLRLDTQDLFLDPEETQAIKFDSFTEPLTHKV